MPSISVFGYIDELRSKIESAFLEAKRADELLESNKRKEAINQIDRAQQMLGEILGYGEVNSEEDEDEDDDDEEEEDYDDEGQEDDEEGEDEDITPGSLDYYWSEIERLLESSLDYLLEAGGNLEERDIKQAQLSVKRALGSWESVSVLKVEESEGCIGGVCPVKREDKKRPSKESTNLEAALKLALKDDIAIALDNLYENSDGNKDTLIKKLIKVKKGDPKEVLMALPKEALQTICERSDLVISGSKWEISDRIIENIVEEDSGNRAQAISPREFDDLVSGPGLVLVDMYQDKCPSCDDMDKMIGKVMDDFQNIVRFGRFDVYADDEISDRFDIDCTPTLLLFKDGELIEKNEDEFSNKDELKRWLEEHL